MERAFGQEVRLDSTTLENFNVSGMAL